MMRLPVSRQVSVETRVRRWVIYSIVIPLFPIFFAGLLKFGQGAGLDYLSLLDGAELYILSVTVLASTKNDLENSQADFSQYRIYDILVELLFMLIMIILIMFAAVYINKHVHDFGLQQPFIANGGIFLGVMASLMCISLQSIRFAAEKQSSGSAS